ncbi:hypothetical protein JKP88DRAFT_328511 [Tribonema minus]|uniref:General transcription factor TFIIB n=1 Tax=Tribonema minus TaxID=303371 RepID=A0A835YX77_9STRA|nr:hypothetical protein JKP88DRAFT_328511 [Tribonema minus]
MAAAVAPSLCPECRSRDIVIDFGAGDIICRGCGLVVADRMIEDTAEWRTYADDDRNKGDPSRCSGALEVGFGSTTYLKGGNKSNASSLNAACITADKLAGAGITKAMLAALENLDDIGQRLGVSREIRQAAAHLLKQLDKGGRFRRKSGAGGSAMCAAVLYIALKRHRAGRTFGEMAPAANVDKREVAKAYKHASRHLPPPSNDEAADALILGEHLVPRLCDALGVPQVSQAAKEIATQCAELSLIDGIKPQVVAAAATWLAAMCCWAAGTLAAAATDSNSCTAAGMAKEVVAERAAVPLSSMLKLCRVVHEHRQHLVPKGLSLQMQLRGKAVDVLPPP